MATTLAIILQSALLRPEFENKTLNRQEIVDLLPDVVNFDAGFKRK
ncbi:hypothetical protein SAMN04487898_101230 [Pedobacter sp. ok626]|nr:hypothetical protein [Pedobacter sp. ok626]SDJ06952.1 hypothetical protein SAMN04487898_101230 [Pedobacter sp. ok626]